MVERYAALIPVRGGSVSIPDKNIKPLCGRPLLYWTLDAATGCEAITTVYVSSDSDRILDAAAAYGSDKVVCVRRDAVLASGTATTEAVMADFASSRSFEHLILIQATSPMLSASDLDMAISSYESGEYDSMLSVVRQKRFLWQELGGIASPVNYNPADRPMRQSFDGHLVENGAFYITSREAFAESGVRVSGKIGLHEMCEESYFEIDEPADWIIAEALVARKNDVDSMPADIALFATDVDGVLTDGGMYYSADGDAMKKFDTRDGMGFHLLREAGIKTAIITSEDTDIVNMRAKKMGVDFLRQGVKNKLPELEKIAESLGIDLSQVAYIGDDINDAECIRTAGVGITVPHGCVDALRAAQYVTRREGGNGAVREAIEYVLASRAETKRDAR